MLTRADRRAASPPWEEPRCRACGRRCSRPR
jgi:hypothetical protein